MKRRRTCRNSSSGRPRGEEIIISKAGKPRARLVALDSESEVRKPGGWEGQVWMADDFDAPLPPDILRGLAGEEREP